MSKLNVTIHVDIQSNEDATFNTFIATDSSSGIHYTNITADEIGDLVSEFIEDLKDAHEDKSPLRLRDVQWKAIHFEDRTLLPTDKNLYPALEWEALLNQEVIPMEEEGHYKIHFK